MKNNEKQLKKQFFHFKSKRVLVWVSMLNVFRGANYEPDKGMEGGSRWKLYHRILCLFKWKTIICMFSFSFRDIRSVPILVLVMPLLCYIWPYVRYCWAIRFDSILYWLYVLHECVVQPSPLHFMDDYPDSGVSCSKVWWNILQDEWNDWNETFQWYHHRMSTCIPPNGLTIILDRFGG